MLVERPRDFEAPFQGNARYELVREVGQGGMGVVYEVLDRERGMCVALKGLKAARAEDVLRFKSEFRSLADIQHPNLVTLGELFEDDGRLFFTMELVVGDDFLAYVRGGARASPDSASALRESTGSARSTHVRSTRVLRRVPPRATEAPPLPSVTATPPRDEPPAASTERSPARFDEARLRTSLAQLALGVAALHRAGRVHRDIKPSNVMVDRAGRVVLLDFGVTADLAAPLSHDAEEIVGTFAYMAPEQASGVAVGPAADWYAVGVVLFEALTGRLPFAGSGPDLIARKAVLDAPAPSLLTEGVPEDLESLCTQLLALDPAARPDAARVLDVLGVSPATAALLAEGRASRPPFVGRAAELGALLAAVDDGARGAAVAAVVEGPSGIGKTALVRKAVSEARARAPRTLELRGRCHENEAIPYNAFDGVVDELSRHLARGAPEPWLRAFAGDAGALLRAFPVLRSVPALAAAETAAPPREAQSLERRDAAFEALRLLLAGVARATPVLLVVDDLHWADAASVSLAEALFRGPYVPGLCLLATARPLADGARCAAIGALGARARVVALAGLAETEARALVEHLAGKAAWSRAAVDDAVREGAGHPMFLDEIVRHAARGEHGDGARLDAALRARVERLPPLARAALEAIAACGAPLAESVVAEVVGETPAKLAAHLVALRNASLVRATRGKTGRAVEPYHDRVREAVYASLAPARRRALHLALGDALERTGAPADALAAHFERSGAAHRAGPHAVAAARAARAAFAFDHAARMFRDAVDSGAFDADATRALLAELGAVQTAAGRPADAAAAFLQAADRGTPSALERLDLRRSAAEQLLVGGYFDEGTRVAREVLNDVGIGLPRTALGTVLAAAAAYAQVLRTGLRWTPRRAADVSREDLARIDVYWSVGSGLGMFDSLRAALLGMRGALYALRAGEEERIARALFALTTAFAAQGQEALARRTVDAAYRAAEACGTPRARYYAVGAEAGYLFMARNDWATFRERSKVLPGMWREAGQLAGWEADVYEQFQLWGLALGGEMREIARTVAASLASARAQRNRFREVALRTANVAEYVIDDAPDRGERDIRAAIESWRTPGDAFGNPHYWATKSLSMLTLYRGTADADAARLDVLWRRFDRSMVRRIAVIELEACHLRAQLALARAARAHCDGDVARVRRCVAEARGFMKRLARVDLPARRSALMQLEASAARVLGDERRCVALLEEALRYHTDNGQTPVACTAAFYLASLVDGPRRFELEQRAGVLMTRERVRSPGRFFAMMMPGWRHPDWR